jgi:hypothetical protein
LTRAIVSFLLLLIAFAQTAHAVRDKVNSWKKVFLILFCFAKREKTKKKPVDVELEEFRGGDEYSVASTSRRKSKGDTIAWTKQIANDKPF